MHAARLVARRGPRRPCRQGAGVGLGKPVQPAEAQLVDQDVTEALQSFGIHIRKPENHPAQILVGDPKTGRWTRFHDVDQPRQVLAKVDELLAAQRPDRTATEGGAQREQCNRPSPQAVATGARPGCVAQPG